MQRRLPEQVGYPYRRASRDVPLPANPHRAGHFAGIHPEDQPYASDDFDLTDDYPQRTPTSSRRYVTSHGQQVIEQGNRRLIIHDAPPPKPRRHLWLFLIGTGMVVMIFLYITFTLLSSWWTMHQMDSTYGFPRTYQTDAVVYAGDSADHPSHYIFLNLNATVEVIEFPHGDSAHARIYKGPTLFSENADLIPITGEFKQVDGKEEMIVHIVDQEIIYLNDGKQFVPQH